MANSKLLHLVWSRPEPKAEEICSAFFAPGQAVECAKLIHRASKEVLYQAAGLIKIRADREAKNGDIPLTYLFGRRL